MLAGVIRLPYSISRHTAELYCSALEAILTEGGHQVSLDRIEREPVQGWAIHLRCANPATIDLLRDVAERKYHPDDPLSLL